MWIYFIIFNRTPCTYFVILKVNFFLISKICLFAGWIVFIINNMKMKNATICRRFSDYENESVAAEITVEQTKEVTALGVYYANEGFPMNAPAINQLAKPTELTLRNRKGVWIDHPSYLRWCNYSTLGWTGQFEQRNNNFAPKTRKRSRCRCPVYDSILNNIKKLNFFF